MLTTILSVRLLVRDILLVGPSIVTCASPSFKGSFFSSQPREPLVVKTGLYTDLIR